jgi:hypothetical protein
MMTRQRVAAIILVVLGIWAGVGCILVTVFFTLAVEDPDKRAIVYMGATLVVVWCLIGGVLMRFIRDPFVRLMRRIPLDWRVRFVLLCIVFALLEEAVTTGLTNLAPYFGGVTDAARITASKDYLEVVCKNSVIVFVPSFILWAVILNYFDFAPVEVMLIYGLTGWLMEVQFANWQNWGMVGMWTFVYGLMVWLPACTVPQGRKVWPVHWWYWPPTVAALWFAGAVLIFGLALLVLAQVAVMPLAWVWVVLVFLLVRWLMSHGATPP